ncbi:MAG: NusA-like transcription termination signal-binding factor, partial [Thermoplasmata archaeon]|nr:NusA-like transcription termination signal-binding factor [Thermoplasmata archaeon]
MKEITLTTELLQYITLFESATGVVVKDCLEMDDHLIFIVKEGQATKAIGKKGVNMARLREILKRRLRVIEFSPDPAVFLMNIFRTYEPVKVEFSRKRNIIHATVFVHIENKARAIGKEGHNLRIAREIVRRHFEIESVSVAALEEPYEPPGTPIQYPSVEASSSSIPTSPPS